MWLERLADYFIDRMGYHLFFLFGHLSFLQRCDHLFAGFIFPFSLFEPNMLPFFDIEELLDFTEDATDFRDFALATDWALLLDISEKTDLSSSSDS